ncbi:MAG TPA: PilZ domain-containing protein [Myxococcaceae bacterium]|nr:PilZ domain-containing protein [Myxococcaceae bacterium]
MTSSTGDYWIRDVDGRVLGPVSYPVLRDLCSARRLVGVTHVSRDGKSWRTLQELPELATLLETPETAQLQQEQQAEAVRLRTQLRAAASAPAHLIFKVAENAPLQTYRQAYFALARRFHPSRLEPTTHPDLVAASREAFAFFSKRMSEVEARIAPPTSPIPPVARVGPPAGPPPTLTPAPPVAPVLTPVPPAAARNPVPPPATLRTPPPPPADVISRPVTGASTWTPPPPADPVLNRVRITPAGTPPPPVRSSAFSTPPPGGNVYRPEDFVGIERRSAERLHANIRVTPTSYRMFTDHALVNISNSGLFISTPDLIPVGSLLDMELTFEGDNRTISARARVVWESNGADGKHERGMGLKLTRVDKQDLAFIKDFVRKAAMAGTR